MKDYKICKCGKKMLYDMIYDLGDHHYIIIYKCINYGSSMNHNCKKIELKDGKIINETRFSRDNEM